MKKNLKLICIILGIILLISVSYNFYQYKKIINYKNKLTITTRQYIEHFAALSDNVDDEHIYAEKYASIIIAKEAYINSKDNHMISKGEEPYSLSILLLEIETIMRNDKENFKKVLQNTDFSDLLFKISNNLEDKNSINKAQNLLSK